jgi:adenosylcobyric acid synthase
MIQGTGSNVGKSLLVAGLCRLFADRGLRVRPFKPQNMSNNAAAVDGGEIGRAQALQARAARATPNVHMNPILLKPETDRRSQIIVQGQRHGQLDAATYQERTKLMPFVLDSFDRLSQDCDLIVVEGAGSPAETNLRAGDIANMGFARAAEVPVVIAGDIDRGGVIASLVGTHAVLSDEDRVMIRGFLVNKFRGDATLFEQGMADVARRTGWTPLGIAPWFRDAHKLPAEDALDLSAKPRDGAAITVAVPMLPRIANFDDLDPLKLDTAINLVLVRPGEAMPRDADLVVIPGSKSTIADLAAIRANGWDIDIVAHARSGGHVLGLCGGYQMLGRTISDPLGVEGVSGTIAGLGLLSVDTIMHPDKVVRAVSAQHTRSGLPLQAYEIHIGETSGPDTARAPFTVDGKPEGAMSADGRVTGTYLHGLLSADEFRGAFLSALTGGAHFSDLKYEDTVDETLDALAEHLRDHLDTERILAIAQART